MKLIKMGKNVTKKILVWHMAVEMIKKLVGKGNCSCTIYFLVKILLVKLNNLNTSICLNLNDGTSKQ